MNLTRRTMLASGMALATAPLTAKVPRAAAANWYDRAIIIDGLGGLGDPYGDADSTRLTEKGWAEMVATGVTALRDTVSPVGNVADPWVDYRKDMDVKLAVLHANPDRLVLVRTAADLLKAKREKKFGIIVGTQDTCMVGGDLDRLATMKKDGITTVQLTYNNGNLCGDGALEPRDGGITKLGKATIERIEAEKLLLDLSHGGARTMAEAAAHAKRPLVISHTGAKALLDHPRNSSDETIKAVADKGGVVGVYFMPFLTRDSHPTGADLIAHIEHVANVAGEDHIGLGSDNGVLPQDVDADAKKRLKEWAEARIKAGIAAPGEGIDVFPMVADYNSLDRYRRLGNDLAKRGWSTERLEKLFGANFLRVYKDAWEG